MIATAETEMGGRPAAERPRILMAIEPRSYRDVVGSALQSLRPYLAVTIVEPDDLALELLCQDPVLVICSLPKPSKLDCGSPAWFEYRPYERPAARVSIEGRYFEMDEVELADLLFVIDERTAVAEDG